MGATISAMIAVPLCLALGIMMAIISSDLKKPSKVNIPASGSGECNNFTQEDLDKITKSRKYATWSAVAGIVFGIALFFLVFLTALV